MTARGISLATITKQSKCLHQVQKEDLRAGDRVFLTTRNSTYSLLYLVNGFYRVSGGWFDRKGLSPVRTKILGCTWGGSVIKADVVAACGLHVEFVNRVITSPISKIFVLPYGRDN